jgi:hypothetical protein
MLRFEFDRPNLGSIASLQGATTTELARRPPESKAERRENKENWPGYKLVASDGEREAKRGSIRDPATCLSIASPRSNSVPGYLLSFSLLSSLKQHAILKLLFKVTSIKCSIHAEF